MNTLRRSVSSSSIPIPKRDGHSMIPTLRRETSNLTSRESRQSTRQSSTSDARSKASLRRPSKSVDRFSHKNATPVIKRPSNYLTVTPLLSGIKRISRASSRSPNFSSIAGKKGDKRPINDKDWQRQQLHVVQNYLNQRYSGVICKLKPGLSIEIFVNISNVLFKDLDPRINITKENYVEEVPARLKLFQYPSAVKPSLMKTVNVPHSWPHVIAILSWLVELAEKLEHLKSGNFPIPDEARKRDFQIFWLKLKTHCAVTIQLENGQDATECFKNYEAELEKIFKLKELENESSQCNIEALRKQLESLNEEEKDIIKKEQDLVTKIAINKRIIEEQKAKVKDFQKNIEKMKNEIKEKTEQNDKKREILLNSIEILKQQVSEQQYTLKDKKELMQKLSDLKFTKNMKEERLKELKEIMDQSDLKLAESRRTVQKIVNKINNTIKDAKILKPALKMDTLRETKFTEAEFLNEIENFKFQYEKIRHETIKELQDLKEENNILLDLKEKGTKENECLLKKLRQMEVQYEELDRKAFEMQHLQVAELTKLNLKLDSLKAKLEKLKEKHDTESNEVNKLEKDLEDAQKRNEDAKETLIKSEMKSIEIVKNACIAVSRNRAKGMELLNNFTARTYQSYLDLIQENKEFTQTLESEMDDLYKI